MEFSFGILKPDCLARGIEKQVISIIQENGLTIVASKRLQFIEIDVATIYYNCLKEDFWQGLLESFSVGDSIVFIVEGVNAIESLNNLVGHCEPNKAEKHTIRSRFGKTVRYNVIHSTATEETFWKEATHFFKDDIRLILRDRLAQLA